METDRTVRDADCARRGSSSACARAPEDGPAANAVPASARPAPAGPPKQALAPLYERLPHGPHGLEREEIVNNQSNRIRGAMVESVYQRGYAATRVAHVIALAGVSRRAFYEHFSNKEDCFLSTFDSLAKESRKRVLAALLGERGRANRLRAACRAFLQGVAGNPRGSQLMLIEAVDGGPCAGQCLRCTMAGFERVATTGFGIAPDRAAADRAAPSLPARDRLAPDLLAPRAIVGGIRFVVARRLREGRQAEIAGLTGEVLDWLGSYHPRALARLSTLARVLPPRQVVNRAHFLARNDRRSRAMAALVKLISERDYADLDDADVACAAGISTEAFHRELTSKHDCLLAILDELAAELHDAIVRATRRDEDWPRAVCKGVQALLGYCAAHPELMRVAFVDVFDAGEVERVSDLLDGFSRAMTKRIPPPERAPGVAAEAIVGGIWAILASYTRPDRLEKLPSLTAHISFFVLAPYIGSEAAVEAIEAARARPRRLAAR